MTGLHKGAVLQHSGGWTIPTTAKSFPSAMLFQRRTPMTGIPFVCREAGSQFPVASR